MLSGCYDAAIITVYTTPSRLYRPRAPTHCDWRLLEAPDPAMMRTMSARRMVVAVYAARSQFAPSLSTASVLAQSSFQGDGEQAFLAPPLSASRRLPIQSKLSSMSKAAAATVAIAVIGMSDEAAADAEAESTAVTPDATIVEAVPAEMEKTGAPKPALTSSIVALYSPPTREDIAGMRAALDDLLDEHEGMAAALVSLVFSVGGSFDAECGVGGSEDRVSVELAARDLGIASARDALRRVEVLFPMFSAGDLLTFAGAIAVEHLGGPTVKWRAGRREFSASTAAVAREASPPAAAAAANATLSTTWPAQGDSRVAETVSRVRAVFQRQGFNDRELVALMGGYAVCRGYPGRSGGNDGGINAGEDEWMRSPASFSNEYFRDLQSSTWCVQRTEDAGPDVFDDTTAARVMFPADMALLWDRDLRRYVEEFASDEDAFFDAFATAFQKLEENGVSAFGSEPKVAKSWYQFW
jgi:cytochrome c peroxidase